MTKADNNESGVSKRNGIALVVDTEVTSYLMMGALSPGLKRHSVSLFEGKFSYSYIFQVVKNIHQSDSRSIATFDFELCLL